MVANYVSLVFCYVYLTHLGKLEARFSQNVKCDLSTLPTKDYRKHFTLPHLVNVLNSRHCIVIITFTPIHNRL
jgi:hypothetical protein